LFGPVEAGGFRQRDTFEPRPKVNSKKASWGGPLPGGAVGAVAAGIRFSN